MSNAFGQFYCNDEFKLAYLAIRKCGCSSIARTIASLKTSEIKTPLWAKESSEHNFDRVSSDESTLEQYLTFTFVRNPYDRFQSFYKNWIVNPPHSDVLNHYEKHDIYSNMPFEECVQKFVRIKNVADLEGHTLPLENYIFRDGKMRVKFVGKLENIHLDIFRMFEENNIPLTEEDISIGHFNRTGQGDLYTEKSKEMIYEFYKSDFRLFGYSK